MEPTHRGWRLEVHHHRLPQADTGDGIYICSALVDIRLGHLVSKSVLSSNSFIAHGSPVFQGDLCKLSRPERLLSPGSSAMVKTLSH